MSDKTETISGQGPRTGPLLIIIFLILTAVLTSAAPAACAEETANAGKITINFRNVDIATFVRFISDATGKNFIYDERLKGKVSIVAPKEIDLGDAFDLLVSVLDLKGFSIVSTGMAYKIIPSSTAKQGAMGVDDGAEAGREGETYSARLIALDFTSSSEVLQVLRPLVSKDGYLAEFGKGNSLLLIDTAPNINKILDIVRLLDIETESYPPEMIFLDHADAETLAESLRPLLQDTKGSKKGTTSKGRKKTSSISGAMETLVVIPDRRLNALTLVGTEEQKTKVKRLISLLDVPPPEATARIHVYYLKNADAENVAKIIGELTTGPPPAKGKPPVARAQTGFTGTVNVTPDATTNSLIIMASPGDYASLIEVIKKLDRRPKQVFVEAMIMEVSLNKARELGIKWRGMITHNEEPIVVGGLGTVDSDALINVLSGMAGLTIGGMGNFISVPITGTDGTTTELTVPGFAALFSLAEFKDVINILSTPHILTSDNTEAEIVVGENVPFLSTIERSSTTTNQPLLQSIERKDVGITLRIKPQISEGGYVKLEIYEEISAVMQTTQTGGVEAADIITSKRSARTTVVVKSAQTVVLGGLIQDKEVKSLTKVPLLGDIPVIGWLFRYSSSQRQKTNLIVFLTPTIIDNFDDLDELTREREKIFESSVPKTDIEGGGWDYPEETPEETEAKETEDRTGETE